MENQAIRKVDFTDFAVSPQTNSVMGKASPAEHAMVAGALRKIDTPEAAADRAARAESRKTADDLRKQLVHVTARCRHLEEALTTARTQGDPAPVDRLTSDLQTMRAREVTLRTDLDQAERLAGQER